jgi:carbohydrate kinase (thermoresistant glucokinase family)
MIIVVMGIAGTGKSTVGKLLASRLSLPFVEGDDFHSGENIAKMSRGIPLTDEDRMPWLQALAVKLKRREGEGTVLACSALKEKYRTILQQGLLEKPFWIYLEGSEETIRQRMKEREGHFMPGELLDSQQASLEVPSYAYLFSIEKSPERIVDEIVKVLNQKQ